MKALLDDYFRKWYGAAAKPAQAFWDAIEEAIESSPMLGHEDRVMPYVYTPQLLEKLAVHIAEAENLADTDRAKLHVRTDRLILEHLKLYMAMWQSEFAGQFGRAAENAEAMMPLRRQLMDISPFFVLDHEKPYDCGIWYWGVTHRAKYYRQLDDLISGKAGQLVAMLPEKALFRLDPNDDGRFAEWYQPAWDASRWESISVTKPFYAQGHMTAEGCPYVGHMWYRFDVDVPALAAGKRVMLLAPVVETEGWLWVNGQYIGRKHYREAYERPNEMKLDITAALRPGQKNMIAMRVATGLCSSQAAGGLGARVFLYSPN